MKTLLILITLLLAVSASAFPAKLRWNKNAPDEGVTEYRIWKWTDGVPALVATVPAVADADPKQSHAMEVQGREVLTVTAFNGFESEHSDQVTVPVKPSKPGAVEVVIIEASADNLTQWEPLAFVPLKTEAKSRFLRARIATISTDH